MRDFDTATRALRDQYIYPQTVNSAWYEKTLEIRKKINEKTSDEQFADILLELIQSVNDPNVTFSQPTSTQTAGGQSSTAFVGIGVLVDLPRKGKDRVLVLTVFDDSPAARAGIKPHDAITRVGGRPVRGEEGGTVISRIRGEPNTQVVLTVQTPNTPARDVTVTRRAVVSQSATVARKLPGTNFGYILPSQTITPEAMRGDVTVALRRLAEERLDGLVLDLRISRDANFPVNDMLNLFANGHVATQYVRGRKGDKIEIAGKSVAGSQDLPLIILVSDLTSGQAETFAGILQDLGRAKIVGNPTQGNVAFNTETILSNTGVQLNVPNSEYRGLKDKTWLTKRNAAGDVITAGGVQPDAKFQRTWEEFTDSDDPHLQRAIELLKGN
jgi:carboxyl-terminal processing protease